MTYVCSFTLESDSSLALRVLSERLNELRDASFMQFASRVSLFIHQLIALWVVKDSRIVMY